jgi:1,4-alpha-glucan branching enzyme
MTKKTKPKRKHWIRSACSPISTFTCLEVASTLNFTRKLGAHLVTFKKQAGTYFAVWAPNARNVSVIGNFNSWNNNDHKLSPRWDESGIWEGFFPGVGKGEAYKYAIHSNTGDYLEKADPFAFYAEMAPPTASIIWDHDYTWRDSHWLSRS